MASKKAYKVFVYVLLYLSPALTTGAGKGNWVCQDYVHDPLLVDGLKFDLRVYAALISLDPVKVYVCKEGLARFCTEKYRPPDPKKGFGDERAHLTNCMYLFRLAVRALAVGLCATRIHRARDHSSTAYRVLREANLTGFVCGLVPRLVKQTLPQVYSCGWKCIC